MTRLSVFSASSTDGYIATLDDDLSWLDDTVGEGEDYGYDEFIATVDALAIGRSTYDYVTAASVRPGRTRGASVRSTCSRTVRLRRPTRSGPASPSGRRRPRRRSPTGNRWVTSGSTSTVGR